VAGAGASVRLGAGQAPHIVLVGLPGAGKTVCGALLAARLGLPFLDLDQEVERRSGRTIREIFSAEGEEFFRDLETQVTASLTDLPPSIVSPGGGWIEREQNRELAKSTCRVVYLRVSPGTALVRLGSDVASRPLLVGGNPLARIAAILERRGPLYGMADAEINTEVLSPKAVVDELGRLALRWGGPVG